MAVNKNMSPPKMAGHNGGGKNEGRGRGEEMKGLKKGPWTAAEDTILMEYVKKHGEGNWNAVPKNTGLARCGKSCRLRWANHLRPNLKKGSFSAAEERVIIELHAKLGNKWATMAMQLPGRTDNEIKNYWNTRMKRRHRAGLPLYPLQLQKDVAAIHLQPPFHGETYYSSLPFSSLLSPSQPAKPNFNHSLSLFNPMSFSLAVNSLSSNQHDSEFFTTPNPQFKLLSENNGASGLSVPISSAFVAGSSSIFTHRLSQPLSPEALNLNDGRSKLYCNSGFSSVILGSSFEQVIPGLEAELPSIQTPPLSTTIALSGASVGACETNTQTSPANSGLLDALLMEAQAMDRNEKLKDYGSSFTSSEKEKQVEEEDDAVENHSGELSSSPSSTGVKTMEGQMEDRESMDDDLMSLLDNFPSTMPQPWPEWYPNIGGDTNKSQASYLPPTRPVMDIWQNADSPAANHFSDCLLERQSPKHPTACYRYSFLKCVSNCINIG